MDYNINELVDKLIENNRLLKNKNTMLIRLGSEIDKYLNSSTCNYDELANNEGLLNNVKKLINDEELVKTFEENIMILKNMPWTMRVSNINLKIKEEKEKTINSLRKIRSYINNNPVKFYTTLDEKIDEFNKIGKEFVTLDKQFIKMFERLGLSDNEILNLSVYVTKQNINVYNKKISKIEKESLKEEKKILLSKLKKEQRNEKLKNVKKRKELLYGNTKLFNDVLKLLKDNNINPNQKDYNEGLAYQEILLNNPEELLMYNSYDNVMKYLLINISYITSNINDINKNDNDCIKNENLENEMENVRYLYESYLKLLKCKNTSKVGQENFNDIVNIHYLINNKTNKTYYEESLEGKDYKYISDAERLIEKMKVGLFESKQKGSVNDVMDCFFIQQGLTYLAFIRVSDKDYITISTSKWNDLFSIIRNICVNESNQIETIKNNIRGNVK